MKLLIAANWKCNPSSLKEAKKLFNFLAEKLDSLKKTELVVCPPFLWLFLGQGQRKFKLGAQNCFWELKGAYTGEISPLMLRSIGVEYVILGHSERRRYFQESNQEINQKIKLALKSNLQPILCVGETDKSSEASQVIREQIEKGLDGIKRNQLKRITIAYEPVWAIGTGLACLPADVFQIKLFIRKILTNLYSRSLADSVKIIYGGSVNQKNALDYLKEAGVDGLLIGGFSLKIKEFLKLVKEIENETFN